MLKGASGEAAEAIPAETAGRILGTTGAGAAKIADATAFGVPGKYLRAGIGVVRGLRRGAVDAAPEATSVPATILDATSENKPFAGGLDEPPPQKILDATGENRTPFAGGMDEALPPKKPAQSAKAPGQAGSITESILSPIEHTPTEQTPDVNDVPREEWDTARFIEPQIEGTPRPDLTEDLKKSLEMVQARKAPQSVGSMNAAMQDTASFRQARAELGEDAPLSKVAQRAQQIKTRKTSSLQ
jgi:hypothetical protein